MKRYLLPLLLLLGGISHAALIRMDSLTAAPGVGLAAGAIDPTGGYAYFVDTGTDVAAIFQTATVTRVRLSDFSKSLSFQDFELLHNPIVPANNAVVIDPVGGYGYFAYNQSFTTISKIHLSDLVQTSSVTLPASIGPFGCGVIDTMAGFAYFGTQTNPAQIVKVQLSNLAIVSSVTLASPAAFLRSAAIDTTNHFAYFGSSTTPGSVTKINLTNFSFVRTLSFNSGEGGAVSAFLDATVDSAWFGTSDSPGRVVRVQLNSFSEVGVPLTLQSGENNLTSVIYDPDSKKAYFGTFTSTGTIVRISAVAMRRDEPLQLNTGEAYLTSAVMDADHYGYFGTFTNPGQIIKIDLIGGVPEITSGVPPSQSVAVGQTASFFITASGRGLTYQWNRDNVAISGANQTTYQLANATLSDDGASFTCTVSNSSGTTTSAATILTVEPDVHVFPNPWRANRHAGLPVTFNEIPPGATVEIFTLAAQWVKNIPENGGIVIWDLRNNAGQNAASGYYFYYVKTQDDRHQLRGKFAIIR